MAAVALTLGLACPAPAVAECALELILAVDVSGSVDRREFALQAEGIASAFEDRRVIAAVEAQEGGVLVTLMLWSSAERQRQVTGWRLLGDAAAMAAFAHEVRGSGRPRQHHSTAIGAALHYALKLGETAPQHCRRRVVDISGDGVNNSGRPPRNAADALTARGYVVNALVIGEEGSDVVRHYRNEVLAGRRAFLQIADGFEDYADAIRRKLLREIEHRPLVADLHGR